MKYYHAKINGLLSFSLFCWLAPLGMPWKNLQGFSLSLAINCSIAAAIESKRYGPVDAIDRAEKKLKYERLTHEMALSHESQIQQLQNRYFPAPLPVIPQPQPIYQPQFTGGYISQPQLTPDPIATTPYPESQKSTTPPVEQEPLTALNAMTKSFISYAIFGGQRTGKSYLAAHASQKLTQTKNTTIYHINLASYGDENSTYWNHCEVSLTCNLKRMEQHQALSKIQEALALVDDFENDRNAILIVDEWTAMGGIYHPHAKALEPLISILSSIVSELSSIGMKQQKAIWTIAPEMTAATLTNAAKAIKKLKLVQVAIPPHTSVDWQGQIISFDGSLFDQLKKNFPNVEPPPVTPVLSRCDRIAAVDGIWLPIGIGQTNPTTSATPTPTIVQQLEKLYQRSNLSQIHSELIQATVAQGGTLGSIDAHRQFPHYPTETIEGAFRKLEALGQGKIQAMPYQGLVFILS